MKANRRALATRPGFRDDEGAVAAILGGVLLVSVLMMAYVSYRVSYVPAMEERQEAAHLHAVEQQLLAVKSALDRHVENSSLVPITSPITLGVERSSLWSSPGGGDQLRFEAAQRPVELSSNRLLLLSRNETSLAGVGEAWSDVGSSGTVSDMVGVHSFRLVLQPGPDQLNQLKKGDYALLTLTGADGQQAGSFKAYIDDQANDNLAVKTTAKDGTVLFDSEIATKDEYSKPDDNKVWIDLLNPEYRFDLVLDAASAPYDVTMTEYFEKLIDADYAITYETYDSSSGQTLLVGGGGGLRIDNYAKTKSAGAMVFESTNQRLVDRRYILENGALVVDQNEGHIFKVEPGFSARMVGNKTLLAIVLPSLQGSGASLMGQGTVTATTERGQRELYVADAPRYEIKVTTDFPALWSALWDEELKDAGLSAAASEYVVTSGPDWAKVSVYGKVTPVGHTYYDLQVTLRQANIAVELES